jgi:mRNA interferase MazF
MTPDMQTYKPGDVVVVPFPFSDQNATKRRPALVCSSAAFNTTSRHLVLAMITTAAHAKWPGDVNIQDLKRTGLPVPSLVRWKLFTLDSSLVLRRSGALSTRDRATCRSRQPVSL